MRYVPKTKNKQPGSGRKGRYVDPNVWCTGPDPKRREKYYAWLKHRAQCRYRQEDYELTWEDWESLWEDSLWCQRGRGRTSLCLSRIDLLGSWNVQNVEIVQRIQHLQRAQEYRDAKNV